ncbi:MAG: lysoplasmalogenase [Bacteroidetes bacterium CHB5]|nr:lysoplasmalogenase [Bacteroidetes bacterium CHB5]
MRKTSLLVFGTLAVANLIAATFNLALLNFITKPLLVPALAVYYLVATSQRSYLFLTALFFCWLGDVLLMQQRDELFFMAGLVAFLTGHVLYIICYRNFRSAGTGLTGPQQIRFSLPIILAGTGLVTILFPHLGSLQIPVLVYALVITVMAMQALFRYSYTNSKSFVLVFVGAVSFMLSDSLLAINKFMQPLPLAGLWIMFTYTLAQYLIVEGVVQHEKKLG